MSRIQCRKSINLLCFIIIVLFCREIPPDFNKSHYFKSTHPQNTREKKQFAELVGANFQFLSAHALLLLLSYSYKAVSVKLLT